jgi:lipopolysaccharide/colanic/teichoic acid biosynthesis glycosyltransferase
MYRNYLKRLLDFFLSTFAFILASPVFLLVTLLLAIANKGKAFFFQARPGKDEKIFKVIKFRTMTDEKGSDGELLPDADRLTAVGSFVRKTSLDEIPQLLNVIKGDMSLIGPRPLLVQYLPLYNEEQKRRHNVRPGISGWAQVNGRNAISWEKKFEYDVWYVDNLSFLLDLKIIFKTVWKVFKSEGIAQDGEATMEVFMGDKQKMS